MRSIVDRLGSSPTLLLGAVATLLIALAMVTVWARPSAIVRGASGVLVVVAALGSAAAMALVRLDPPGLRIRLDSSEEPMIARGEASARFYRRAVATFGDDDVYVIAMTTGDVFTAANLNALRDIGLAIRRLPGVRAAESLADTLAYRYVRDADLVEIGAFLDDIPTDPATLDRMRRRALDDRIYTRTLVSRDGATAAINVHFRKMTDGEFVAAGLDEAIQAIVERHAGPDRRFFTTGRQHIKTRAHHQMVRDLSRLIPVAVVVGAAVAWLFTGSLRMAAIPIGTSLFSTASVFAALAVLDRPLNILTLVLGPMLICVGSVYGVHVLARFDVEAQRSDDRQRAALAALRYSTVPVTIAAVTTCIGFATLAFSRTPAIAELGVLSALGVALSATLSLVGIPALLATLPGSRRTATTSAPAARLPQPSRTLGAILDGGLTFVAPWSARRPKTALVSWSIATVAAVVLIPRIVVDTNYLSFFDARSKVRRDFAAISRNLVGAVPIYVVLDGASEGTFREPENLRALASLQGRIDALDGVSTTLSAVDLVETLNRAFEKDDAGAERIPDTRGEVADLVFMIPKNRLRPFANANHSSANVLVRTARSGSAGILDLERRIDAAIRSSRLPAGVEARVTGNALLVNHTADGIAGNQIATVGAAALAIFVLVSFSLRSARTGALAMIPNVVPVVIFYGILGAGAAPLSLPTSMIGCIALGIAIDDTAHFLVGYRRRRAGGESPEQAAAGCVRALGRPIALTSFMLVAGFSVLTLSGFATLREFGMLAGLTMGVCLASDLVLLPAILIRARV